MDLSASRLVHMLLLLEELLAEEATDHRELKFGEGLVQIRVESAVWRTLEKMERS